MPFSRKDEPNGGNGGDDGQDSGRGGDTDPRNNIDWGTKDIPSDSGSSSSGDKAKKK